MNNIKNIIIAAVLALGIGYAFGRYKQPAKVITNEKQVIVKETETIVREVKQADGTIIKETITKDTSKQENNKSNKTSNAKSKYLITGIASYNTTDRKPEYGGAVQLRLGDTPIFGGVIYQGNKFGVTATIEL